MNVNFKNQPTVITWRFYLILSVIFLVVLGLVARLFDLTVLNQRFLRKEGDERVLRLVSTPSFRGMIVDRNGFPLAVSTTVYSVWMNPQEFTPNKTAVISLQKLLNINKKEMMHIVQRYQKKKREFVYLKRALSPEVAHQVKALGLPGIYLQEEYRRYYPEGEIAAQVIGFTNIDDRGQEGLELAYNQWLQGEPGKKWVIKDRIGREISEVQSVQDQKPGHDLVLSIDRRIQYLAYRELFAGVVQNRAQSGTAIVMDSKTGEVLAMVNYPSFNPNNRSEYPSDTFRNRAVTDTFEPGSTIKAFTVATGLASGKFRPDSKIDTAPGWIKVGRNIVRDEHNKGIIDLGEVLQYSSNIGASKIVLSLPPDQLWNLLSKVGFGETTGVGFPGEQAGMLVKHNPWGSFTLATLSFGYGLSVTALQLTEAYSVLANSGIKLPVSLLRVEKTPVGVPVISPKVSKEMLTLLESVLEKGGTAEGSSIPGYRVAGKTGTARKVGVNGYEKHHYTATFVGIAPVSNPRYVVSVIIHDPQGKHYLAGFVAAPVFQKIMEGTLRMMDVPPDAPSELNDAAQA